MTLMKAAMPVGAARKTGLGFPAWRHVEVFRSVKVFPDPATPSTFKRS